MMTKDTQSRTPSDARPRGRRGAPGAKTFADRVKDVDQKILEIRRVTRVVAGGRRMSFAVSMLIGDKQGVVGLGTGKGNDTALAIAKALKDAKKHAIKLKRTESASLPHEVQAKFSASRVMLFPNNGKGVVLGAALRDIAVLAGLKDVSGKVISGSKNKLNTARAAMKALTTVGAKYTFGHKVETPATENAAAPEIKK